MVIGYSYLSHDSCLLKKSVMFISILLLFAISACPTWAALPQFSWNTLPVFFHSSNNSGQYNEEALQTIAKFQMVTIEKWMGSDVQNVDDEDEMVMAMKAIKKVNPNVSTYFYMNSFMDIPLMTRMHRQLQQNPEYYLRDSKGIRVKTPNGYYAYDLSNPKVRQWWLNICLNATKYANGDGCFCDSSQRENMTFYPSLSEAKQKAWAEGMLNLTRDVQKALGDDNLLIGKVPDQPFVKAVQIEYFRPDNDSINALILGASVGQYVQAHVPISVSCSSDLTDYIAAFLIGAGELYSYFGCGTWNATGNDTSPLTWRPEYDKPVGPPKFPALYYSGVWSRSFALGTSVTFDTKTNKGTIEWA